MLRCGGLGLVEALFSLAAHLNLRWDYCFVSRRQLFTCVFIERFIGCVFFALELRQSLFYSLHAPRVFCILFNVLQEEATICAIPRLEADPPAGLHPAGIS